MKKDYETYYKIDEVQIGSISSYIDLEDQKPGFRIIFEWDGDIGFGQIEIEYKPNTESFYIDSELMSRDFIKAVLCKMVDNAQIRGEPE